MYKLNKKITVRTPGTCGELAQGVIDGNCFHITCPVDLFSYVSVELAKKTEISFNKWKTKKAVEKMLKLFREKINLKVRIQSEIPVSKGMASSTADIVGGCLATANLLNLKISEDDISKICLFIEPTDGIMFPGITLFDHREGKIKEYLGSAPKMKILVVDLGICVDTIEFNKKTFLHKHLSNQKKIKKAFELIKTGIRQNDIHMIGEGATISAFCNQKILYKPELEKILNIVLKLGAVGINIAHSGGVVGILLNYEFSDMEFLKTKLQEKFKKRFNFYETELINGGGQIENFTRRKYYRSN
ncbi:MAG: hypothetical protein Q7K21_05940 [Elusimicrobiota bacterium]|nr:hypothetical protein [Elusimicrobiota bacterium]